LVVVEERRRGAALAQSALLGVEAVVMTISLAVVVVAV
jgi:hypothetical protein